MGGCCGSSEQEVNKFEKGSSTDISKGPLANRGCTDIICLAIFLVHLAGFVAVTFSGVQDGNPRKLYAPRDYQGAYCGVAENWNGGPDLEKTESLAYTMNLSATVDNAAKQMMCSSGAESVLRNVENFDILGYRCACCKDPCLGCEGSYGVADLANPADIAATITARMNELTTGAADFFNPSGMNGDMFNNIWAEATKYFNEVCLPDCVNAINGPRNRTVTYSPAPDDPLYTTWQALLASGNEDIVNTMQTSFTFSALNADVCPYEASKCVPMPGVDLADLHGGYCQFSLTAGALDAVGGAAGQALEASGMFEIRNATSSSLGTALGDIQSTLSVLVIVCFIAVVVGMVYLVFFRFFIGVMIWFAIFLMLLLLIAGGAFCIVKSTQCEGATLLESGQQMGVAVAITAGTAASNAVTGTDASEGLSGIGKDYCGVQQRTQSGKLCMNWADSPNTFDGLNTTCHSGSGTSELSRNYCRNPYEASTIWCYTTESTPDAPRWELCQPIGVIAPKCQRGYSVEGQSARDVVKISGFIIWALAVLWIILVCCMYRRIALAVAINKVAAVFIMEQPFILLLPVIQSLISLVWILLWTLSATFLVSQVPDNYTPKDAYATYEEAYGTEEVPGKCTDKWPTGFVWKDDDCGSLIDPKCWKCAPPRYVAGPHDMRFLYSFFSLLWNNALIIAFGQFIIAGAVAIWFFTPRSRGKRSVGTVKTATWWAFRYHWGSLCLGAFIIALVQFIRYCMKYLEKQGQAQKNYVMVVIMRVTQCCIWCFEKCLKFLNKNAYIQMALLGTNFCTSAKNAFTLIGRNFLRFGAIAMLGWFTHLIGYLFIAAATAVIGYFLLQAMYPEANPVAPMIIYICVGYVVGQLYMNIFGLAVDTCLQCFIAVEEMGGEPEEDTEKFVPRALANFVKQIPKPKAAEPEIKEPENLD